MSNIEYDSRVESSKQRVIVLNELIEKELSKEFKDGLKLKKLYLAAITLLNSHYSSIIHTELYRTVCEVFHLPLDNSEFINTTSTEYNKLSDNVTKLEMIIYSNFNDILGSYADQTQDEQEPKIKR